MLYIASRGNFELGNRYSEEVTDDDVTRGISAVVVRMALVYLKIGACTTLTY
jgi:hypothetical protein